MKNKWLGSIFSEMGLGSTLNINHNCAVANARPKSHKSGRSRQKYRLQDTWKDPFSAHHWSSLSWSTVAGFGYCTL